MYQITPSEYKLMQMQEYVSGGLEKEAFDPLTLGALGGGAYLGKKIFNYFGNRAVANNAGKVMSVANPNNLLQTGRGINDTLSRARTLSGAEGSWWDRFKSSLPGNLGRSKSIESSSNISNLVAEVGPEEASKIMVRNGLPQTEVNQILDWASRTTPNQVKNIFAQKQFARGNTKLAPEFEEALARSNPNSYNAYLMAKTQAEAKDIAAKELAAKQTQKAVNKKVDQDVSAATLAAQGQNQQRNIEIRHHQDMINSYMPKPGPNTYISPASQKQIDFHRAEMDKLKALPAPNFRDFRQFGKDGKPIGRGGMPSPITPSLPTSSPALAPTTPATPRGFGEAMSSGWGNLRAGKPIQSDEWLPLGVGAFGALKATDIVSNRLGNN